MKVPLYYVFIYFFIIFTLNLSVFTLLGDVCSCKGKKTVFKCCWQIEMDELHISNGDSFYSLVSDHHYILPRILVAKGMDSFEVGQW